MSYKIASRKMVLLLMLVFLTSAYSVPTIDGSTDDSMKHSIQKVKKSLPINKQSEFDDSIKILMFKNFDMKTMFANAFAGKALDKDKLANDIKKTLDGKTGLEVIAEAKIK